MKKYSKGFLEDLARLVSHGPGEIERLISDLSDPGRRKALIHSLKLIGEVAHDFENGHQKKKAPASFSYIDINIPETARSDPGSREKLEAILRVLKSTESLQSRPVLVSLAERLDVPLAKKDSRARVVQKIINRLAQCDGEQLTRAFAEVRKADRGSTESFMDLASFITNSPRSGTH